MNPVAAAAEGGAPFNFTPSHLRVGPYYHPMDVIVNQSGSSVSDYSEAERWQSSPVRTKSADGPYLERLDENTLCVSLFGRLNLDFDLFRLIIEKWQFSRLLVGLYILRAEKRVDICVSISSVWWWWCTVRTHCVQLTAAILLVID